MKETTLMLVLAVAGAVSLVDLGNSLRQMATAGEPTLSLPVATPVSEFAVAAGHCVSKTKS